MRKVIVVYAASVAVMIMALPCSAGQQGMATVRRGSLELTLKMYKTKVKRGEPIWYQIQIRNVGKEPMSLYDNAFFTGNDAQFLAALEKAEQSSRGLKLKARNREGKPVGYYFHPVPIDMCPEDMDDTPFGSRDRIAHATPEEYAKVDAMIAAWRKQGLSSDQIQLKLNDYSREQAREKERKSEPKSVMLGPGQKATTRSWVYKPACRSWRPNPPTPPEGFAEFPQDEKNPLSPGEYEFHVVYDQRLSAENRAYFKKKHMRIRDHEDMRLATPLVTVEIQP